MIRKRKPYKTYTAIKGVGDKQEAFALVVSDKMILR